MKRQILLVEDDLEQASEITGELQLHIPDLEIILIQDERSFVQHLKDQEAQSPDLIICGVMLPWITGSGSAGAPDEVVSGTFRQAGTRCWQRSRQHPRYNQIPWIYFSILTKEGTRFAENSDTLTAHVEKVNPFDSLLMQARKFLT